MNNPYEPPSSFPQTERPAPFSRPSLFAGSYVMLLAFMLFAVNTFRAIASGQIRQLSGCLLALWIGYNGWRVLMRDEKARKLVVGLSRFVAIAFAAVMTLIFGFHGGSMNFFGYRIADPTPLQFVGCTAAVVIVAAIPAILLITPRAKREFEQASQPTAKNP